ncbi:MAG: HD domain-containing protein, partial [Bacteroidales bacterium]|nr:HD domain-containing protein [Bacteroidales bacterium]
MFPQAYRFAKTAHKEQEYSPQVPYISHLTQTFDILAENMDENEGDKKFALTMALLHDTLEDTDTTAEQLAAIFGQPVADGVSALTKNSSLPYKEQLNDSLQRILTQPNEVAIVKMADRCSNLSTLSPVWNYTRKVQYGYDAELILNTLKGKSKSMSDCLQKYIDNYKEMIYRISIRKEVLNEVVAGMSAKYFHVAKAMGVLHDRTHPLNIKNKEIFALRDTVRDAETMEELEAVENKLLEYDDDLGKY